MGIINPRSALVVMTFLQLSCPCGIYDFSSRGPIILVMIFLQGSSVALSKALIVASIGGIHLTISSYH